jgi:hypothetical protein
MAKRVIFGIFLVASLYSARADDGGFAKPDWIHDAKTVTAIDKEVLQLRQPKDLPPLASYSRHYQGAIMDGNRRIVWGTLISPMMDTHFKKQGFKFGATAGLPIGVHIISDRRQNPAYPDGACGGEEFVTYDIVQRRITEARCNGVLPLTAPEQPPFVPR